ncbi:hypothetical protein MNQ95_14135 [Pseudoxanthomonas daejeonensis]|uniref:hypothetical protein n=1 Tax=Pseudoxanthomonas daejeonensis TaxID=266062 RepID=UPI001F5479D8|nr:hypothetical protein [Pseudoxanthomonas daejeonensis]UNK57255.1 hypothetical protein MNQ95_14135 [Pseudoxanthomonas daejeonensis]
MLPLFLLAASAPLSAQQLSHFFCYVPDPASGTVFVSPVMPIGPMAERAGYGAEFLGYLRGKGLLRGQAQGYCQMRPSVEAITRTQSALAQQSCPECGGATRFQGVAWSRNGTAAPAPQIAKAASAAHSPGIEIVSLDTPSNNPAIEILSFDAPGNPAWLLVMGNRRTGRVVVAGNRPSRQAVEKLEAKFDPADGWKTLLISTSRGAGAVVCGPENGETRFFVASEQADTAAAQMNARQFALQNLRGVATAELQVCGGPWDTRVPDDRSQTISDDFIQEISDEVKRQIRCDPAHGRPCPPPPRPTANGVRG